MKILFCAKHVVGSGGQEGFLRRLSSFLIGRGHEVVVVAAAADPVVGASWVRAAVPQCVGRSIWDWAAARAVAEKARELDRDVSFGGQKMWGCNVLRPGGGVEAEYWRVRLADRYAWRPLRALARVTSLKRRFDLDAESRGYHDPQLRVVVVNSDLVRKGLLRRYPALADKVRRVYNGADLERFNAVRDSDVRARIHHELGWAPEGLTAVFAGHNFRLKGLFQALAVLKLAGGSEVRPRCRLIVMGGGRTVRMKRVAQRLGLANAVRFVGNRSDAGDYYAASDVLLFPTFYDPCANVTFEALASGIPVITTKRNGASEIIDDACQGWTVDHPGCIAQMAEHLKALHDPVRLADMKAAARALAVQHSMTAKLGEIEEILCEASRLR